LSHTDANDTQDAALDAGGNSSFRGINIEGGTTQWGDGTTDIFFLPATPDNSYINLHNHANLAFDYNGSTGPVTLDVPIGGGAINASLNAPGVGDVEVMNPPGGHDVVVFSQPMFYNGTTTIDSGATLQLGTGHSQITYKQTIELEIDNSINYDPVTVASTYSGDGSLLLTTSSSGGPTDSIVDDGVLVIDNTENAITLSNVSGSGSIVQQSVPNAAAASGVADTSSSQTALLALLAGATKPTSPSLTLTGVNAYTGGTTIEAGATLLVDSATALGSAGSAGSGPVINRGTLSTTATNHVIAVPGDYQQ
jgi:autotransporter-associated beta strand protein